MQECSAAHGLMVGRLKKCEFNKLYFWLCSGLRHILRKFVIHWKVYFYVNLHLPSPYWCTKTTKANYFKEWEFPCSLSRYISHIIFHLEKVYTLPEAVANVLNIKNAMWRHWAEKQVPSPADSDTCLADAENLWNKKSPGKREEKHHLQPCLRFTKH